jgi:hypothetical protein
MKAFVSVGGVGGPLFFAWAALAVMLSPLEAAAQQQPPNMLVIMGEMLMKTEGNN